MHMSVCDRMKLVTLADDGSLPLVNDGDLDVFFIGVGSAFAKTHYQTNFILVKGDTHLLVDFGQKGQIALETVARLDVTDIEAVLPTHSHADHVGGLETLALMNRYVGTRFMGKPKLKMVVTEEYERVLWDYTLRGGLEWNELDFRNSTKLSMGDFFEIIRPEWKTFQPREVFDVEFGDLKFELFRTKHIPEQSSNWEASFVSYGLYFPGERVLISGDTRFDQDMLDMYGDRSDVIIHDVQFFPGAVHAPLNDLRRLPAEVRSKMLFMHYADDWADQDVSGFGGFAQQGITYRFGAV